MNPSSERISQSSVCLVHDWLVAMRGGEKVLEAIAELFPKAPIYTLFANSKNLSPSLKSRDIRTSFLQHLPGILKWYRWLLPIFPFAVRTFDLGRYDVVISVSHCVAKSVRVHRNAIHICYCNAPIRYAWDLTDDYLRTFSRPVRMLIETYFKWLRKWDCDTAQDVTYFIGNSMNIANKIKKYYGRESAVIYPPVDIKCDQSINSKGDYFLSVGALVPYKRVDLLIEAFNQLRQPLRIVGDGPLRSKLEQMIRFEGIQFEGWLDQVALLKRYADCRALIFPGEEDFGIVPLEAQGFGKPVIAYGKGGVLETVLAVNDPRQERRPEKSTGIFFYRQTQDDLIQAVYQFNQIKFDETFIHLHARNFGQAQFKKQFSLFLENLAMNWSRKVPPLQKQAVV